MSLNPNDISLLKIIVNSAKEARISLEKKKNTEVNKLLKQITHKVLNNKVNYHLCSLAVKETHFGNIKDKVQKNINKTNNLLNDLKDIKIFEPFLNKENNIYEIYKPIGVICGVTPSTNPIATSLNYVLNSIKARNSIIICPNLRSYNTVKELVEILKSVLEENKISKEIVNIAPKSILRDDTVIELFNLCDKNIVTGNQLMISRVKKSIKPFLVFGAGNVPIIVDENAKIEYAAQSIVLSKSFDNSTSCSADSVLIVNKKIYTNFRNKLKKNNVYFLNKEEKKKLDKIYFVKGVVNHQLVAKSANEILEKININTQNINYRIVAYEFDSNIKKHYILNEKILPLIGITTFKNFEEALKIAENVLEINGKGHSAGIYSSNNKRVINFSKRMPVSRIIVNQPHSQSAGGSIDNNLKSTLSLGCGNWGNNILNDNLSFKDFCNTTRIVLKKKLLLN